MHVLGIGGDLADDLALAPPVLVHRPVAVGTVSVGGHLGHRGEGADAGTAVPVPPGATRAPATGWPAANTLTGRARPLAAAL